MNVAYLPLPATRPNTDGKVVGIAAQAFSVNSPENPASQYVGYLMGHLTLPPGGIKDPESTGACTQCFTVLTCQPGSLEVAFGIPDEEDGKIDPKTAQRFLLSSFDQFRVPPGNAYRLQNHSLTGESRLAWTIIRPRV